MSPVGQCSKFLGQKPGQKRWHDVKMLILKKIVLWFFLNQFKWTYFIYEFINFIFIILFEKFCLKCLKNVVSNYFFNFQNRIIMQI